MVLRSGARQILKSPRLQGHVSPNGLLPRIIYYRLAGSAVFSSINRTASTNAKKLDMATVMIQSDINDPLETFREHFKKGTLTRPLVVSCLEDAVRLNRPGSRMGEAAIMWLWRSYDSIEYPDDADIVNSIAILLVREGKEELMWDWMQQETKKSASSRGKHELYDQTYMWRKAALRSLVEAKTHLATDQSLDAALETFFRGTKVPYYLDTQAAANFCHRQLVGRAAWLSPRRSYDEMRNELAFTKTSPGLWDAFYTEIGKRPGPFAQYDQALMMLQHPRHPDPWPLLECWLQAEHDENHGLRRIKSYSGATAAVESSRDMRIVLKHQGHPKEAAWVKRFIAELYPRDGKPKGKSRRERLTVDGKPLPSL